MTEAHLVSRAEYDKVFNRSLEILAMTHSATSLRWRAAEARRRTTRVTGAQHRPSSLFGLVAKAVFRIKVKGESMEWKLSKGAWKGIRAALGSALALGAVAVGDALLTKADTPEELIGLGAPALLIPVLLGLGATARNYLKVKKQARRSDAFVTPPGPSI